MLGAEGRGKANQEVGRQGAGRSAGPVPPAVLGLDLKVHLPVPGTVRPMHLTPPSRLEMPGSWQRSVSQAEALGVPGHWPIGGAY